MHSGPYTATTLKVRPNTKFEKIFDAIEVRFRVPSVRVGRVLKYIYNRRSSERHLVSGGALRRLVQALKIVIPFSGTFRFAHDGERIKRDDTPSSVGSSPAVLSISCSHTLSMQLGLEHQDQIDAFLEQLGGASPLALA